MRSASYYPSPEWGRGSIRRRSTAAIIVVVVHVLLLFLLLMLTPQETTIPQDKAETKSFRPLSVSEERAASKPAARARQVARSTTRQPPTPPVPPKTPKTPPTPPTLNLMQVSRDVFAASDISKLPSHHAEAGAAAAGTADAGAGSGAAGGKGEGPGGEQLYNADWYTRPTRAEMAFYLPKNVIGWGMIACKTVANYHVEDCQELGESPPGSGLARAVRQAAWQFRVLPPRIGGRPLIGAWVRIRYELTDDPAAAAR